MSKKKEQNIKNRNRHETSTLKDLIDNGVLPQFYHLNDGNYIGGLTMPKDKTDH